MTKNSSMDSEDVAADGDSLHTLFTEEDRLLQNFRKKELLFKILIIGDYGVGKTSIIKRYADGTFSPSYKITIGADFAIKILNWDDNTRINVQLWDIAGHERFGYLTGVYYRYAVAAAIVFDLTRPETFKSVEKWLLDLRKKVNLPGGHPVPVVVLANKGDITIATLPEEIVNFCEKYNILAWFITSAKDDVHIDEAMITLINAAIEHHESLQFPAVVDNDIVKLNNDDTQFYQSNGKLCCQR
ncbi:ras-related protein Rab-32 [Asbolus verrucosus]|uniref:Ras-related protein Rab n=1 Tax=Asbolus verrucosus TaxID=1661398 RepID=A0A482W807_ASBVE|nr:ras-related protein Rab-32 [Asbolus verrucosus]